MVWLCYVVQCGVVCYVCVEHWFTVVCYIWQIMVKLGRLWCCVVIMLYGVLSYSVYGMVG